MFWPTYRPQLLLTLTKSGDESLAPGRYGESAHGSMAPLPEWNIREHREEDPGTPLKGPSSHCQLCFVSGGTEDDKVIMSGSNPSSERQDT